MNNTYGTVKPSLINVNSDVEIWYHYRPSRTSSLSDFSEFRKYSTPSSILTHANVREEDTVFSDTTLMGMYTLSLPISDFGQKGIYTIYIKPSEYHFTIKDIGVLAAYPEVNGIVIDLKEVDAQSMFATDNLVGYRVEYFEYNNGNLERQDYFRIVTGNNNCEPITQTLTSANSTANTYRFNNSGSLSFLTVTPSTNPSYKSNSTPFIGAPNQDICLTNTKFDPVMIEVEMVEHDVETLSIMMEGEQLRNLENGRVTTYNFEGEVYKQMEFSTIKDNYTTNSVAEIKTDKTGNIDYSLDLEELKNS